MRLRGKRIDGRWTVTLVTGSGDMTHTATQVDAATLADALRAVIRMAREGAKETQWHR